MKKFLLCLALLSVISSTAVAKPFHHPLPPRPHRPAPIIIHDHYHTDTPAIALASGLIGFVAGTATAASTPDDAIHRQCSAKSAMLCRCFQINRRCQPTLFKR